MSKSRRASQPAEVVGGEDLLSESWLVSPRADQEFSKLDEKIKTQVAEELLSKRKYKMINGLNKEFGELRLSFDLRAIVIYEGAQTKLVSIVARKHLPRKIKVLQRSCPTTYVEFSATEIAKQLNGSIPARAQSKGDAPAEIPPAASVEDALSELQSVQEYLENESMSLTNDVRVSNEKIEQLTVDLGLATAEMERAADVNRRQRQQAMDQFEATTNDYADICWEHEQLLGRIVANISQLAENLSALDHRDVRLFRELESAVHQLAERQRAQQIMQANAQRELSLAMLSRLEAVTRQLDEIKGCQQQSLDRLIDLEARVDQLEHRGAWAWFRTTLRNPVAADRMRTARPR